MKNGVTQQVIKKILETKPKNNHAVIDVAADVFASQPGIGGEFCKIQQGVICTLSALHLIGRFSFTIKNFTARINVSEKQRERLRELLKS